MARVTLVETSPWRISDGVAEVVRLAGGGSRAYAGHRGFTDWRSGIANEPRFTTLLGFDQNGWSGGSIPQTGVIRIAPSTAALLNKLADDYNWPGAPISIYIGDDTASSPTWNLEITGTVAGISTDGGAILMTLTDLSGATDIPVLIDRFTGAGGIEGDADVAGRIKRRSWGRLFNVEGRMLLKASNIYEFSHPTYPLQEFVAVKDKGRSGTISAVIAWQGTVAATLAALVASVPVSGGCTVAPSIACVKWWTQASGPLTADLKGEIGTGYVESTPAIAERILAARTALTCSNTAAAILLRPGVSGVHVEDESQTVGETLDLICLGVSMVWVMNPTGTVRFEAISMSAPVETVKADSVERVEVFKPVKSRRLGYLRNHRIHTAAEISAATLDNGVFVDDLIGVEPGATNNSPGDDLQKNASFAAAPNPDGSLPGWNEGTAPGQQFTRVADSGASGGYVARLIQSERIFGDSFAVVPAMQIYYRLRLKVIRGRGGTTAGSDPATIAAVLRFYTAAGVFVDDKVIISAGLFFTGNYVSYAGKFTVSATAFIANSLLILDEAYPSSAAEILIDHFDVSVTQPGADVTVENVAASIVGQGSGATANSLSGLNAGDGAKLAAIEAGADITRDFDGPAQISVSYDADLVAAPGQLPKQVLYKLLLSGVDVSAAATWGAPVIRRGGGSFSMGNGATAGVLTISSTNADTELRLPVVHNGISRSCMVQIRRFIADPPTTETSATDNSFLTVNSTSLMVVSDELLVAPGGSGTTVEVRANFSYLTDLVAVKTVMLACDIQYYNGSTWVSVGAEQVASFATEVRLDVSTGVYYTWINGTGGYSPTFVTGLSGPTRFRCRARVYSGAGEIYLEGSFRASGI